MNIITQKNTFEKERTDVAPKGKVIRKAQIARQLLQRGARMIDLKPDRDDPDRKRSVYIFEQDENFEKIFSDIIEENKQGRQNSMQKEIDDLKRQIKELQKANVSVDEDVVKE